MNSVSVLLVGGFGHAVCVFDEWLRDDAAVHLIGAVETLSDEPLDGFLAHPWSQKFTPAIYQDLQVALDAKLPDIVVVSTRPDLNPELIAICLRAGCHVIAEKPLAADVAGLDTLHKAVKETGKYLLPMLGMLPAFVEARQIIAEGLIGEPVLVNARKSYQWGTRADWFKQTKYYGGIWSWVGIHSFNTAHYILGRNASKVLAAQEQNCFHPDYAPECPDCLSGLFLLEGDLQMTVSVDLLRPDGQKEWGDDWVRIVGSEGSLEANPGLNSIRLIRKGHDEEIRKVTAKSPPFYTPFLDVVAGDVDYKEVVALGFQLTASGLAADQASSQGEYGIEVDAGRWAY